MALDKDKLNEVGVAPLKRFAHSPEQRVRIQAIKALGVIGPRVKSVIPALIELLDDKDPIIVIQACTTLATFGAKDGAPALPGC